MAMMKFDRLTPGQMRVMKDLALRCGMGGLVTLKYRQRLCVPALWRRGLVEIYYRQVPDGAPTNRGPFFGLSLDGKRLAYSLMHPLNRSAA